MFHLKRFKEDMCSIIQNISFTKHTNDFQRKLKTDIRDIRSFAKVFVPVDKSTSFYQMSADSYKRLHQISINKSYKKCNAGIKSEIDSEAKTIASSLNLSDIIEKLAEKDSFITLKDHIENFQNHPA